MTESINSFLFPIEKFIRNNRKYIGYILILLAFSSFGFLLFPNSTKESGEKAILVLWIILWMPILSRVFGIQLFKTLLPLRKELGILMGTLAFVHGAGYMSAFPEYILDEGFWWNNGFITYLAAGFGALVFTMPLLLTSSDWAIRKLGKNWKRLHRLVYIIIIFTVVHVVLIKYSRELEIAPVILMILYFIGKGFEWRGVQLYKEKAGIYPKGQLWLCVPCGYIYDPVFGDTDSGIIAGTEFVDIPNNWRCPVCGVTKSDFIPYSGDEITTESAKVVEKIYLNPTTVELTIETEKTHNSIPGQFIGFFWEDQEGTFQRSYSIVKQEKNQYTFTIKLDPFGRGARVIEGLAIGDNIRINGVFGNFTMRESKNQKIFIATGTGLAPIYNMMRSLPSEALKILYFSVAAEAELFYIDKLKEIPNLKSYIHITREQVDGYEKGRVDMDTINTSIDTEWYLCGNPKMVTEAIEKLKKRGYKHIYKEEF